MEKDEAGELLGKVRKDQATNTENEELHSPNERTIVAEDASSCKSSAQKRRPDVFIRPPSVFKRKGKKMPGSTNAWPNTENQVIKVRAEQIRDIAETDFLRGSFIFTKMAFHKPPNGRKAKSTKEQL